VVLRGLQRRRAAERQLFLSDIPKIDPSATSREDAPILSRPEIDSAVSETEKTLDQAAVLTAAVQRLPWLTRAGAWAFRVLLLAGAFYLENWYVTVPLTVLFLFVVWYVRRPTEGEVDEETED